MARKPKVNIVGIKFHYDQFDDFRRSDEVRNALLAHGQAIAEGAAKDGGGRYRVDSQENSSRSRVFVATDDRAARLAEAEDRTLSKQLRNRPASSKPSFGRSDSIVIGDSTRPSRVAGQTWVDGYTKKDGTTVKGHWRKG